MMFGRLRVRTRVILAFLVLAVVVGGLVIYQRLFREMPAPFFETDEDHFLFGSIGTEAEQGLPYWIWLVLPRIFPEYLPGPGGYAALGMLGKDGHELPIGFSKVTVGFPRVGINCAICHTSSVRLRPGAVPMIVPAGPAHQTAEQQYLRFLFACASDPRFTADTILAEIARNVRLSAMDRMLYRFGIIPQTRRAILELQERNGWMNRNPPWLRGRIDPFNPVKFGILEQPIDQTIGNSDMQPVWNLQSHAGYAFHWDGLNTDLREVVLSSALGDGATRKWVDRDFARWESTDPRSMSSLRRVQNFMSTVTPPKYPFAVDPTLAAAGAEIFRGTCAACHGPGGPRIGTVIPIAEIGTDRHRLDMWTPASATAYNAYGEGHAWKFSHFRTGGGYVAVPLDGLWLRAPYLHNGSVPSLTDMLTPPEARPRGFWRGYDVYDPVKVGFVTSGADAQRIGSWVDPALPGNSPQGHPFGTTLDAEQKHALIEFLKTL
jgi:mono/diheme cytochrome c family protein